MKYVKDKSITNWEAMVNYWYLDHDGEKPDYLEQPDYKNSVCWRDK